MCSECVTDDFKRPESKEAAENVLSDGWNSSSTPGSH